MGPHPSPGDSATPSATTTGAAPPDLVAALARTYTPDALEAIGAALRPRMRYDPFGVLALLAESASAAVRHRLARTLCLAGHITSSGATWCCNLPPRHDGPHSDGLGDTWPDPDRDTDPHPAELPDTAGFDEWAIVELYGRRRAAGRVREVQIAGAGMLRLDIPATPGHQAQTQFYAMGAVYGLHPTTERLATAVAAKFRPEPVERWELPALTVAKPSPDPGDDEWAAEGMALAADPDLDYGRDIDDEDDREDEATFGEPLDGGGS